MIKINLLPEEWREEEEHSPLEVIFLIFTIMIGIATCLLFIILHFRELPPQKRDLKIVQEKYDEKNKEAQQHEKEYKELDKLLTLLRKRQEKNKSITHSRELFTEKLYYLSKLLSSTDANNPSQYKYPIWFEEMYLSAEKEFFLLEAQCIGVGLYLNRLIFFFREIPQDKNFLQHFSFLNLPEFSQASLPLKQDEKGWSFKIKLIKYFKGQ